MSEAAKTLGLPEEVEYEGETYLVSQVTGEIEAAWEKWLKARAWAELKASALNVSNYPDQESRLIRDFAAGKYAWGSEVSIEAQFCRPGREFMMFLRLRRYRPQITIDVVRDILAKQEEAFTEAMKKADADPFTSPAGENAAPADAPSDPTPNSSPASSTGQS